MHSLISRYALEVRQNGKGTGAFFLDKNAAKAVSEEVTQSHLHLSGKKAKKYLKSHFASTWEHFDVNHDGLIEVERMPQFLRWFTENALDIDLQ